MTHHTLGPVELHLIGFDGDRVPPPVVEALAELVTAGTIRVLDALVIEKSHDGEVTIAEVEEDSPAIPLVNISLAAAGLAGEEDVEQFAALLPHGASAALITIEHTWASELASRVSASGATVLASERIPAPIVNALLDSVTTR